MKRILTHIQSRNGISHRMWPVGCVMSAFFLFACCLPPFDGLYDRWFSHKWYAVGFAVMLLLLWTAWRSRKGRALHLPSARAVSVSALAVLAYCLAYTFVTDIQSYMLRGFDSFPVHGMFDNATGLSLNLCLLLALSLWNFRQMRKEIKTAVVIMLILTATVIILSGCRTGLMCVVLMGCACMLGQPWGHRTWRIAGIVLTATLVITVSVYALSVKTDSTSGRKFIAERTMELIANRPLTGYGLYGFEREYMRRQVTFFHDNPDSPCAWYADDITHPLNEFLYAWADFGIAAPLLLAALFIIPVVRLIRSKDYRRWYSLIPLMVVFVFCLTSYPHKYPLSYVAVAATYAGVFSPLLKRPIKCNRAVAVLTVAACVAVTTLLVREAVYEARWSRLVRISQAGGSKWAVGRFDKLYTHYRRNPYFLYSDMVAQYKAGNTDGAMELHGELSQFQSGYDMELLAGDACRHSGNYGNAARHYSTAHDMCPVRFAPLEGMLDVYIAKGDTANADKTAWLILAKAVKVPSATVTEIQEKARKWVAGYSGEQAQ